METSYERGFLLNSKKILAAAVSVAAIASLTACGGVKDDTTAAADSGNVITIGTTDKITSLDPAGSYDTTAPTPCRSRCSRSCMPRTTTPPS